MVETHTGVEDGRAIFPWLRNFINGTTTGCHVRFRPSLPKGKGAKFEYKSSTDSNDNSYKFEDEVLLSSVKLRKLRHLFVNRSQVRIVKH